jgi:hypothetical protein
MEDPNFIFSYKNKSLDSQYLSSECPEDSHFDNQQALNVSNIFLKSLTMLDWNW